MGSILNSASSESVVTGCKRRTQIGIFLFAPEPCWQTAVRALVGNGYARYSE